MTIHIYFLVSLLRYKQKIQEICTQNIIKKTQFQEQNGFYNSFGETVLNFYEIIFWYIIPTIFQHFLEFFFRFKLYFISFSVQVISYRLYNIQV